MNEVTTGEAARLRRWPHLLRLILAVPWLLFILWLFSYSMPLSGLCAAAVPWLLIPFLRARRWIPAVLMLLLSLLVVWNVGLIEYGKKSIDLHCRVLGYSGAPSEDFCRHSPGSYEEGKAHQDGPLFSRREQVGVHGFNVILAAGGTAAGLSEVAWETLYMSFAPDPVEGGMAWQPKGTRLAQCRGGGRGTRIHEDAVSRGGGSFLLDSSTVRTLVAAKVPAAKRVAATKRRTFPARKLVFRAPPGMTRRHSDEQYYGGIMRRDNLKAPITLVVPDGRLHLEARGEEAGPVFEIEWRGTISYPANAAFQFPLWTLWYNPVVADLTGQSRSFPLIISESAFCGMTLDGAMNPYQQIWATSAPVSDPRFSSEGKKESVHGWIELILGRVM